MARSLSELENKLAELEARFAEIENLNTLLSRQVKEYYLLFDSVRKLGTATGLKDFYKILDKVFKRSFKIDEYAVIMKHQKSDILSVFHSMGLSKRRLKEIFYHLDEGMDSRNSLLVSSQKR